MEHYGTIEKADTYATAIGNADWSTGTTETKTAALVRASRYVDALSGLRRTAEGCVPRFPGRRTGGISQALQWPRTGARDIDGYEIPADVVPVAIEYATYEAAIRELANPGSLSPDYVGKDAVKREKIGPIETEYAVASENGSGVDTMVQIAAVDAFLASVMWCRRGIGVMVV